MVSKSAKQRDSKSKSLKAQFNSSQIELRIKLAEIQQENIRLKKESKLLKAMLEKMQQNSYTLQR